MTRLQILLSLLLGALVITVNSGCVDPTTGDDDIAGDDDVADDDDDDTTTVESEVRITADPGDGDVGRCALVNGEPIDEDDNVALCDHITTHTGLHQLTFESPGKIYMPKEYGISADTEDIVDAWSVEYCEKAWALEGYFRPYDKPCDDPSAELISSEIYEVYTDLDTDNEGEGLYMVTHGLSGKLYPCGNQIESYSGTITGTITEPDEGDYAEEAHLSNGVSEAYYCFDGPLVE